MATAPAVLHLEDPTAEPATPGLRVVEGGRREAERRGSVAVSRLEIPLESNSVEPKLPNALAPGAAPPPPDATLARIMGQDDQLFGAVRPRERGEGYRIDVRPFGFIYTVSGVALDTERTAQAFLDVIRADISVGKAPEDAVARFLGPKSKPNLVTRRYQEFLAHKKEEVTSGDLSPRTLAEYTRYARKGGELSFWEGKSLSEVDRGSLERWSQWMARRGLGAKSRRNVMGALRSCMTWLRDNRRLKTDVPRFPFPKGDQYRPNILTPEVQARILARIEEPARGAFLALATMGLRPGEARALSASNVRLDAGTLVVDCAMKGHAADAPIGSTKTRRYRELPLSGALVEWLEKHLPIQADAPLFPNPRTRKRWSHWALWQTWRAAGKAEGFPKAKLYEGTKHTFATAAKARGVEDRAVQAFLGHADPRSTARYAQLVTDHLRAVLQSEAC